MDIVAVLAALKPILAGLTISAPVDMAVKEVHEYPPNRDSTLPDTPCWMLGWTFSSREERPESRHEAYTIRAQFFVRDADLNKAARIATAFHRAYIAEMDLHNQLGGAARRVVLRGGDPTLVNLEWGGQPYVGLDEFIDVDLRTITTFAV